MYIDYLSHCLLYYHITTCIQLSNVRFLLSHDVQDNGGVLHEVEPVCILDFYVHESQQRKGFGKVLFEEVLKVKWTKCHEGKD